MTNTADRGKNSTSIYTKLSPLQSRGIDIICITLITIIVRFGGKFTLASAGLGETHFLD